MIQAYSLGDGGSLVLPMGLNPASISAGRYSNELISSFDQEMFRKVFSTRTEVDRHPQRADFFFTDLCKYLGFMMPLAPGNKGQYGHWEKDWIRQSAIVDGDGIDGAGGAGADITFTLDTSTIYTDDILGKKYCYIRPRESLTFQIDSTTILNARVKSVVLNLAGTSFVVTATPDDASVDALSVLGGAGALAGAELAVGSTSYAEGSRQGVGRQTRNIRYFNQVQIIKDDDITTGSHFGRSFEVENIVTDDGRIVAYKLKGVTEAELRYKYQRDHAILFSTRNDNYFEEDAENIGSANVGTPVNTTQGIIPFAFQNGNLNPYGTTFTIDEFDSINDTLNSEAAPMDYIVAHGSLYGMKIREVLKNYLDPSVRNQYTSEGLFEGMGKEAAMSLAVSVGFHSLQLMGSNRRFHFKEITSFNDPKAMGSSSYNFKDMAIFMPFGMKENAMPKSRQTEIFGNMFDATKVPYFGYVYVAKDGYSREVEHWMTGAAGDKIKTYTDDWDVQRAHFRGEFGGHGAAGNLFLTHYPGTGGSGS